MERLIEFIFFLPVLAVTIACHEFAHAWVADRLGDPTPRYQGRLTLNPLAHLDFLGTIMIFLIRFGWGKPVQINPANFKNPKRDAALSALAGPAANLIVAFGAAFPYQFLATVDNPAGLTFWVTLFLGLLIDLNIVLAIFNFLPFPPLDGSKIIGLLVPVKYERKYQAFLHHGMAYFMVFIILDIFLLERILGVSVIGFLIGSVFEYVKSIILLGNYIG